MGLVLTAMVHEAQICICAAVEETEAPFSPNNVDQLLYSLVQWLTVGAAHVVPLQLRPKLDRQTVEIDRM